MAKKSLGQHFLRSERALKKIIEVSSASANDTVLEIGPGEGVLTDELLKTGARVVAVEKDDSLIPFLEKKFEKEIAEKKLTLIHGDALTLAVDEVCEQGYLLVANIPYYITGAILRKYLAGSVQPKCAVLLVQKEVAERIVARDKKESILSLSVKVFGVPAYIETVKAGSFSPPPKVDSAILAITDIGRGVLTEKEEAMYFALVKAGFGSKRKQLINTVVSVGIPKDFFLSFLEKQGFSSTIRAEDMPLSAWITLAKEATLQFGQRK
ncbi:MAG: 16S rRNA (adenine(1518)-N(6)/adenine(1519)-N(6))-dimethyltransferase RsmA [Candidatus Paceibacterota bacterium]